MKISRYECDDVDVTCDIYAIVRVISLSLRRRSLLIQYYSFAFTKSFALFVVRLNSGEELGKRLSFDFLFFVAKIERFEDALGEPFHLLPTVFKFLVDIFLTRVCIS